ncbi:MAG: terpene utilization protein AtuA, partial [Gammaproteobacteria bacterium]|nr:terpene utilization protein AtuA [Gammaproteobacteria bacterium]
TGLGLATPPGLSGFQGGRPKPSPVVRLFSFLLPKRDVSAGVEYNGQLTDCAVAQGTTFDPANIERPNVPQAPASTDTMVPLVKLAWARSGDKGDKGNVGVIARQARYLPYIWSALGVEVVGQRFAHFLEDTSAVERFLLPGCHAINFLMDSVLGGGGIASLRNDPQAKGYAQLLLEIDIPVPQAIADEVL